MHIDVIRQALARLDAQLAEKQIIGGRATAEIGSVSSQVFLWCDYTIRAFDDCHVKIFSQGDFHRQVAQAGVYIASLHDPEQRKITEAVQALKHAKELADQQGITLLEVMALAKMGDAE